MWFCLLTIALAVIAIVVFVFAKGELKALGVLPAFFVVIFLWVIIGSYVANRQSLIDGQELARTVLDSKKLNGILDGDMIKVSNTAFDITNKQDIELLEKISKQNSDVERITAAQNDLWANWLYPRINEPLLKIKIVK